MLSERGRFSTDLGWLIIKKEKPKGKKKKSRETWDVACNLDCVLNREWDRGLARYNHRVMTGEQQSNRNDFQATKHFK